MNSLAHSQSFMSSFYNNASARGVGVGVGVGGGSSSASMLVEAALNSVGNMIDSESNDLKVSFLRMLELQRVDSSQMDQSCHNEHATHATQSRKSSLLPRI